MKEKHIEYTEETMSMDELSFLLYATQGVKSTKGTYCSLRTVPCGGARHEFETYLLVSNVDGLTPGYYHYLSDLHALELLKEDMNINETINKAVCNQMWAKKANVLFTWSCIPYRSEWRYSYIAHRVILMDIGHVGENLYLACEALKLGTCGNGAFDLNYLNGILGLDGEEEFMIYSMPVGKIN